MISLTTAVGAACASYYFLSRLNAMQEELDQMKRAMADMSVKLDGVDRRFASSTRSIKRISEDLVAVHQDLSTLEQGDGPAKRMSMSRQSVTPRGSQKRSKSRRDHSDEDEAEGIMEAM